MTTVRIDVRIINIGEMRADKLPEGAFIVFGGVVSEITGGAMTSVSGEVRLILRHNRFPDNSDANERTTWHGPRDHMFHVVKPVSVRTETD